MGLFEGAKKLANKMSDSLNKNKWDSNCINRALYEDAEASRQAELKKLEEERYKQELETADFSKFEAQVREMNERKKNEQVLNSVDDPGIVLAPALAPIPCIPPVEKPVVKPSVKSEILNSVSDEFQKKSIDSRSYRHTFNYATSKVVDNGGSKLVSLSNLPTVDASQSIFADSKSAERKLFSDAAELVKTTETIEVKPVEPEIKEDESLNKKELTINGDICYYVKIVHNMTYPAIGSVNIMRACDSEYVWRDQWEDKSIPDCEICERCGRKVEYTEIKVD